MFRNSPSRRVLLFLTLYLTGCSIAGIFAADQTLHPARRPLTAKAETATRDISHHLDSDLEDVSIATPDVSTLRASTIHPHRRNGDGHSPPRTRRQSHEDNRISSAPSRSRVLPSSCNLSLSHHASVPSLRILLLHFLRDCLRPSRMVFSLTLSSRRDRRAALPPSKSEAKTRRDGKTWRNPSPGFCISCANS